MADLTDEEKAAAIAGDVEEPKVPVEPTDPADPIPPKDKPEDEEPEEPEPEKPEEEPEEPDSTFTKQFPNLKGETPEEYLPELEKAYDNSFKEALRLNKELKDNAAIVEQAKQIVANAEKPADPANPPVNPALAAIDEHPAIQYAKAKQTEDMLADFDDFKKQYPQATDQQNFDALTKASDGINLALTSTLGRKPTYKELFPAIARSLGWQPTDVKKDATIRENASSGRTQGSQSPATTKPAKVSDNQVDAYMKMFTSKTREEAIKELSEVV